MNKSVKMILDAIDEIEIEHGISPELALKILTIAAGGEDNIMYMLAEDQAEDAENEAEAEDDETLMVVDTFDAKTDSEGRLKLSKEIISTMEDNSSCSSKGGCYVGLYKDGAFAAIALSELQLRSRCGANYDIIRKVTPTANGELRIRLKQEFGANAKLSVSVLSDGSALIEHQ